MTEAFTSPAVLAMNIIRCIGNQVSESGKHARMHRNRRWSQDRLAGAMLRCAPTFWKVKSR